MATNFWTNSQHTTKPEASFRCYWNSEVIELLIRGLNRRFQAHFAEMPPPSIPVDGPGAASTATQVPTRQTRSKPSGMSPIEQARQRIVGWRFLRSFAEATYLLISTNPPNGLKCSGAWQSRLSTVIASRTFESKPTQSQECHGDFAALKKKGECRERRLLSVINISKRPGALGLFLHSPQTVEFVSDFAADYYGAFEEEYDTALCSDGSGISMTPSL